MQAVTLSVPRAYGAAVTRNVPPVQMSPFSSVLTYGPSVPVVQTGEQSAAHSANRSNAAIAVSFQSVLSGIVLAFFLHHEPGVVEVGAFGHETNVFGRKHVIGLIARVDFKSSRNRRDSRVTRVTERSDFTDDEAFVLSMNPGHHEQRPLIVAYEFFAFVRGVLVRVAVQVFMFVSHF